MNKQITIWVLALAAGIGLIWFFNISREGSREPEVSISASATPVISATPEPSPAASRKPIVSQQPEVINKYPPAECTLTGSITFLSPTLYENKDANIIYKNIDSVARHIIWAVSPGENLSVGPNLFASLPLPDGTEDVTVTLPENYTSKNYTLTAKVTYGVIINRDLVIKESSCVGQIPVTVKF
ncbi:MAG: hypothetical protein A2831_00380 [Candidatus Yanofskybacteria bacterium RIFCSPHIGHO2_01_FULL_44_17]|uniref:Uncharacterized protein n=1 Tax=Candidatus Yanofskybacteria bacterium RIFCSPHIGHO2_01_FULL_44_17 TaxID=1802668 RepID=A0A1F8EXN0_9BACT|nr:MAG: hypothetical protein A2831_00380 [Candidatus Yanofskybacteria bacterium RIFCSPHIGHO2_01_FULL_44_17]